jgi:hypothetical protein
VLALGLAVLSARAEETKFEAEEKQAAKEEAKEIEDRLKGIKSTVKLTGRFIPLSDTSEDLSPAVVGSFVTVSEDNKPGPTYLVKVDGQNKGLLDALKLSVGKNVQVGGKMRNRDENGVAKYFLVMMVSELAPTPRATNRRKIGGV